MSTLADRRFAFNAAAADYEAARPSYPDEMIEDIIRLSALPPAGKILEVGCGTGQATLPFARGGYALLCLDIGAELLALAAQKFQPYPDVRFLCQAFEDWQPGEERFDLFLSATAFHWIPPAVGYPKAAGVLKNEAHIALVWNYNPGPFIGFFTEVQELYRQWVPEWNAPDQAHALDEDIRSTQEEINQTGLFEPVQVKTYLWSREYSTENYLRLLNTYSDHQSLDAERKSGLFTGIGRLIDDHYGGKITRPYLTALFLAQKRLG